MNPEDFEKIKEDKAELLAQLEEAKLAYQKSLDELDKQKDAVELAARNYRVLVNKVEADLHEVPEELRKVWEAEDKASKSAYEREQAIDAIQEGFSQMSKGITALGNKLGDTFEKVGESLRKLSDDQATGDSKTSFVKDEKTNSFSIKVEDKEEPAKAEAKQPDATEPEANQSATAEPEASKPEEQTAAPDTSQEKAKDSNRIVIELEEPKRAGAIEPPYKQGDPHR